MGKRILDRVAEQVGEVSKVEVMPKLDGRNMIMVLAPDRRGHGGSGHGGSGASGSGNGGAARPRPAAAGTVAVAAEPDSTDGSVANGAADEDTAIPAGAGSEES